MNLAHALRSARLWSVACTLLLAATVLQAQWSPIASPPLQGNYWGYASAFYDGKIYTFGGVTNGSQTISNATLSYDLGANTWGQGPNLTTAMYLAMGAESGGKIYIIGGQTGNFAANTIRNTMSIYDPSQGSMTQGPTLPKQTSAGAAVELNGKIYVVGGIVVNGANLQTHTDLQVFDVAGNSWSTLTNNVPYGAYNNMATTDGTYLYIAGGQAANGAGFTNAYRGTVTGDNVSWTPIANLPVIVASGGMDLLEGQPFIAGGISAADGFTGAYTYDAQNNSWNSFFTLAETHASSRMEGDGTTPYLIAGSGSVASAKAEKGDDAPVATVGRTTFTLTLVSGNSTTANVTLGNNGTQALTANVAFSGAAWASDAMGTIPAGGNGSVAIPVSAAGLAEGRYQTTGMLTTNDPNATDIPVEIDLWVVDELSMGPSIAVLEEAHGTWCPPCGTSGIPAVEAAEASFGERLIVLSHHDKGGSRYDPFSTTQGEALNNRLGLNAFPTGSINRVPWVAATPRVSANQWSQVIASYLQNNPTAQADVKVLEYEYNAQTRRVTAKVEVKTGFALNTQQGESINLTAMITEDEYEYTQAFSDRPAAVIKHENVVRHYYPDNDGQAIEFPVEAKSEDGWVIKPNGTAIINVVFNVPQATTPTSAGPLASVAVTPDHCYIAFIATVNNGQALGPVLGGTEMPLTGSIGPGGPSIAVNWGATSESGYATESVKTYDFEVTNNTDDAVEVDLVRAMETLPNGWSSEICTAPNLCDDIDNAKYTIPASGKQTFSVKIYTGAGNSETGTVRMLVRHGETTLEETYSVTTGTSSVAVAGEMNGLSLGEVTPNPASSEARIAVTMPSADDARLELFTTDGRKVAVLFEGTLQAGDRSISADVSELATGTYVLVLHAGENKVSRTLTIVR